MFTIDQQRPWLLLWLTIGLTFIYSGASFGQWGIGLEALEEVEDLPQYRAGVLGYQVSSADFRGGDDDGSGYLYREDSLYVIFDQEGPGCVYRIWVRNTLTAPGRQIKLFFDDEVFPSISTTVQVFFSGFYGTFLTPLTGNGLVSSGGNYCYTPLPFEKHLKIALVGGVEPHQVSYQVFPPDTPVETYSGEYPLAVLQQWQSTGSDPKDPMGNITTSGSCNFAPGQTHTLLSLSSTGSISGIRLIPNPTTLSLLQSLRLRFYWDNSATPQVDCSFGSFFGTSLGLTDIDGLLTGVDDSEFYCY
ncbi:MAG: DUF2961 domain-containing protein, partial [bacterium]